MVKSTVVSGVVGTVVSGVVDVIGACVVDMEVNVRSVLPCSDNAACSWIAAGISSVDGTVFLCAESALVSFVL